MANRRFQTVRVRAVEPWGLQRCHRDSPACRNPDRLLCGVDGGWVPVEVRPRCYECAKPVHDKARVSVADRWRVLFLKLEEEGEDDDEENEDEADEDEDDEDEEDEEGENGDEENGDEENLSPKASPHDSSRVCDQ